MPTHPQEEEMEEENEEDMNPPKLGDVWDPSPSPSTYDSNSSPQNSFFIYDKSEIEYSTMMDELNNRTYHHGHDDMSMDDFVFFQ